MFQLDQQKLNKWDQNISQVSKKEKLKKVSLGWFTSKGILSIIKLRIVPVDAKNREQQKIAHL